MDYPIGSTYPVYWSDYASTTTVKIEVSIDNQTEWYTIATGVSNNDTYGYVNTYNWTVDLLLNGISFVKVTSEQTAEYTTSQIPTESPSISNKITFTKGYDYISVKVPYYQYTSILTMGLHYSKTNTGYKIYDDGSPYDIRRCDINTMLLSASDQDLMYSFFSDIDKGRGNNVVLSLGSDSGFFPFLPDKGDSGDFICSVINYNPGQAQLKPFLQHSNTLSIIMVYAPSYTPGSTESEGSLQIGTLTTLRPVQTFPNVTSELSIIREVSRGGIVSSVDIGSSADSFETDLNIDLRPGNAAALITYLQSTRSGDISIVTPANSWLFGIEGGSSGTYSCKLLSNEIKMTHENFNLFKTTLRLYKK